MFGKLKLGSLKKKETWKIAAVKCLAWLSPGACAVFAYEATVGIGRELNTTFPTDPYPWWMYLVYVASFLIAYWPLTEIRRLREKNKKLEGNITYVRDLFKRATKSDTRY